MLAGLLLLCMGCNDWLDVRPKSQVKEGDLFENEAGFQDALIGIYVLMGRTDTYGGNSTMGFLDMLAQTYSTIPITYNAVLSYNYQDDIVKGKVDAMWNANYNAIANCNYLLKNIAEHGDVMAADTRALVEGEALALRAFLHFDLLRGFAPSYKMGKDELAIPYIREITNTPVAQSTVSQVLDYILEDLAKAKALLEPIDPIGPAFEEDAENSNIQEDAYITDGGFWQYRQSRMNYYGVTALMARVYLYKEDMQNALVSALEVIDSDRFSFVQNPASLNPERFVPTMMQSEYITSLYVYDLQEGRSERYFKDNASETCVVGEERMNSIFEGGMALDIRPEKWFALLEGNSTEYVCKYAYGYQIPLLKLSEMYLIAAEASGNISYVDSVRVNRGYVTSPLPAGADLQEELQKEYQKEFIAEGQLFYYYKRRNLANIPFTAQTMNRNTYVFPVPDNELEFGNFKQE